MLDLKAIKARCEAATPGPWIRLPGSGGMTGVHSLNTKIYHASFEVEALKETHDRQKADAAFIAAAREDIPALITEVERLRAAVRFLAAVPGYTYSDAATAKEIVDEMRADRASR